MNVTNHLVFVRRRSVFIELGTELWLLFEWVSCCKYFEKPCMLQIICFSAQQKLTVCSSKCVYNIRIVPYRLDIICVLCHIDWKIMDVLCHIDWI